MPARAHILVVEDEPRLRDLLRLYLERDGHAVTVVGDGRAAIEAVDAADTAPIDLVVLDLMLPGLGGESVLEGIRASTDIPVLIASAKRSDAERIAGLRMGADDYLAKPFNPHELTARVAAILRRTNRASAGAVAPGVLSLAAGRVTIDQRRFTLDAADGPVTGRLTPGEIGLRARSRATPARSSPAATTIVTPFIGVIEGPVDQRDERALVRLHEATVQAQVE